MSNGIYDAVIESWRTEARLEFPPSRFAYYPQIDSTSSELQRRLRSGEVEHFAVVTTDFQSAGRGRRGDRWEAASGRNLLFSVALSLPETRQHWTRLPHLIAAIAGAAIESVISSEGPLQAKWPNDLYYQGRKLAGILVETSLLPRPFAIVGVGINVNMRKEEFPSALREQVTSLYEILGCESSRWFLLGLMLEELHRSFPSKLNDFSESLDWIRKRDYLLNRKVTCLSGGKAREGFARGLGNEGELLLETEQGERESIVSAEKLLLC
jgi:BirA family transcriptional regulator, biotin operon repressor / biotin---[acetyl-CoA-carboxylase] ligase